MKLQTLILINVNGYPHSKHSYQKTRAKYRYSPKALTAAKQPYDNENDRPYANDANDVSIEHIVMLSLFYKGTFFSIRSCSTYTNR